MLTPINQDQYYYALECLPPIYPSEYGKEYLISSIAYELNTTEEQISTRITQIFQNSEPTNHEMFWSQVTKSLSICKPVYATYFKLDGHTYKFDHDFQDLSLIQRSI